MIAQTWQKLLFKHLLDLQTIGFFHVGPVDGIGMAQMRHRTERIERIAAFRGHTGIGHTGSVDIKAHVISQNALAKYVAYQTLITWTAQDRVMARIGPHL